MARKRRTLRRKEAEKQILRVIYNHGPVSQADIAGSLHLTDSVLGSSIDPLVGAGLLSASNILVPEKEKPDKLVDFVPSSYFTVGVDAGPYATYCCVQDVRDRVLIAQDFPVCPKDYPSAVGYLAEVVSTLIQRSGVDPDKIAGVCIGTPGFVDSEKGLVRHSTMYDWGDVWLADDVRAITGYPCMVENNARCRALSASRSQEDVPQIFAYFYVAKGICSPMIIGNNDYPGAVQLSGEIGHMVMMKDGPECPSCGHRGCLEALSSERAVVGQAKALRASGAVTDLPQSGDFGIAEVMEAARAGDRRVQAILDEAMVYLGLALSNVINILNPALVLVDGYMLRDEKNKSTMLSTAREHVFAIDINDVEIRYVEFDKYRTARGAAAKAVERFVIEEEPA